ncbi:MAG: hypothetical protein IAF94_12410, partial [Pirellulaceae bacterium]|nr:hypothetical protein [Pirellulaceae bacterium]
MEHGMNTDKARTRFLLLFIFLPPLFCQLPGGTLRGQESSRRAKPAAAQSASVKLTSNTQPAVPLAINPFPLPSNHPTAEDLFRQNNDDVARKSWGCIKCHEGARDMHDKETVKLGCVDCHGGNADCETKEGAHVAPSLPNAWPTSGNPVRSYALLNHESPEFVRFVNPGDLRIAHNSCGSCHEKEV